MRLSAKKLAFGVSILVFAAPSLFGQKVATDFDKKANFENYKTFMWLRQPSLQNPLMNDRLKDDIDAELTAKGWTQVSENADVGIVANGATQQQQTQETFYTGFPGWRWSWADTTATTQVEQYTVGTLVVDLFDTHSKQAIFRGTATDTLSDKPEKNASKLNAAVKKMFQKFPPNSSH